MKHSMLVMRPLSKSVSVQKNKNIFGQAHVNESLPLIQKKALQNRQSKLYDFVGSTQFKRKQFFPQSMRNTDGITHRSKERNQITSKRPQQNLDETMRNFSKIANSTINRQTILTKLSKHQQIQVTKDKRNIDRYRQYQQYWDGQADKMKTLLNKKRKSIIQPTNDIVVEQNPDKIDILNNYVVHYWQMSLRNHNPILKQHIKGNKYGQVELQKLLQRDSGIKQVQGSIPKLPLESLNRIKKRELSLTGRSKSHLQNTSITQRSSYPYTHKDVLNQQQVYRISYDGAKKYLGVQGF